MSPGASDLTVHRMSVRAAPPPPGAPRPPWRLRVGRLLDGADLRPASLPPSAVLVVRSLAVAVPGELSGAGLVEPGRRAAWARAARERLDGLRRSAARPHGGRVPSGASALVFADPAEWLACGVADGLRGRGDGWWWPAALRSPRTGASTGAALVDALLREAPRVPAVLDHLDRWGWGELAVRRLGPVGAAAVLAAVRRSHGLEAVGAPEGLDPRGQGPTGSGPRPAGGGGRGRDEAEAPGWVAAVPAHGPRGLIAEGGIGDLPGPGRELLLVALALRRAPSRAHSSAFQAAAAGQGTAGPRGGGPSRPSGLARRPAGPDAHPVTPGQGRPPPPGSRSVPHGDVHEGAGGPAGRSGRGGDGVAGAGAPGTEGPGRGGKGGAGGTVAGGSVPSAGEASPGGHEESGEAGESPPGTGTGGASPAGPQPVGGAAGPAPSVDADDPPLPPPGERDAGWTTELGGVLFLLNLLEALQVQKAARAWTTSGVLGPWALLEIVARGLLKGGVSDPRDPVWEALATLDGRSAASPPGEGVTGEGDLVLPRAWVPELVEEAGAAPGWVWGRRRGRLRVWSEAGVPVAAVDTVGAQASGASQARELLAGLGLPGADPRRRSFHRAPLDPLAGPLAEPIAAGVRPWLAFVLPFLRHRLHAALGDTPLEDVLRSPGRLFLTSSHVDLVLPMAAARIPARRAGLDRNPGWLPAAGRVVLFHFDGFPHPFA